MVSDVTRLQEVTISQLFHPDDTPERKPRGKALGDAGWQEWRPGGARRCENRATLLLCISFQPPHLPSAAARRVFAELQAPRAPHPPPLLSQPCRWHADGSGGA